MEPFTTQRQLPVDPASLSELRQLKSLSLGWSDIKDATYVQGLLLPSELAFLKLDCCELHYGQRTRGHPLLAALQATNLKQLQVLVTHAINDNAETVQQLAAMPHLQEVSLGCAAGWPSPWECTNVD